MARYLTFVREPRKLPVVLSEEEIVRLLEAAPGVKYKAAFSAAYGAGLRVSEVASLKVSDIDSKRMLLRIEQGRATTCSRSDRSEQGRLGRRLRWIGLRAPPETAATRKGGYSY